MPKVLELFENIPKDIGKHAAMAPRTAFASIQIMQAKGYIKTVLGLPFTSRLCLFHSTSSRIMYTGLRLSNIITHKPA